MGIFIDIDIDIDIDIPFFCSQIIRKFYFLHVENASKFVPEMENILLENGTVVVNNCANGAACQCDPSSALVNFTKLKQKYYSLRLKTGDKQAARAHCS